MAKWNVFTKEKPKARKTAKKSKEVKSNSKKLKVNVKEQPEKSDDQLENLHQAMVAQKPDPAKKIAEKRKAPPTVTRPVRAKLTKMQSSYKFEEKKTKKKAKEVKSDSKKFQLKANVKEQPEKTDDQLENLHQATVAQKSAPAKKKAEKRKAPPTVTRPVHTKLIKMLSSSIVEVKKTEKKSKEVKSNSKELKANVKEQPEKTGDQLENRHQAMVAQKPAPAKKKAEKRKALPTVARPVRTKLTKMQSSYKFEEKKTKKKAMKVKSDLKKLKVNVKEQPEKTGDQLEKRHQAMVAQKPAPAKKKAEKRKAPPTVTRPVHAKLIKMLSSSIVEVKKTKKKAKEVKLDLKKLKVNVKEQPEKTGDQLEKRHQAMVAQKPAPAKKKAEKRKAPPTVTRPVHAKLIKMLSSSIVEVKKTKKKAKEFKLDLKKLKVNVKEQPEKSDDQLENLHQAMVVQKPAPAKKKTEKRKAPPTVTRPVLAKLTKMQSSSIVEVKKTKKKAKEVKSDLKKLKVNVKEQPEKYDVQLENLHQAMVVLKAPAKKKTEKRKSPPTVTRPVRAKLTKMQSSYKFEEKKTKKKAMKVKSHSKKLKANVKEQPEISDVLLENLHQAMVVQKPAPAKKKAEKRKAPPTVTRPVHTKLIKMLSSSIVEVKKTKKKAKEVKSDLKKLKVNVKEQPEKSDDQLENLYQTMVAQKPAPAKKKAEKRKAPPTVTRPVHTKLIKMLSSSSIVEVKKTKKKAKEVKSDLKKLKVNVKEQPEKSDDQLENLYQTMVAQKPAPAKKKAEKRKAPPTVTRPVHAKLIKMQSSYTFEEKKTKKKAMKVKSHSKKLKASLKEQPEQSDDQLENLHQAMVVRKPAPARTSTRACSMKSTFLCFICRNFNNSRRLTICRS